MSVLGEVEAALERAAVVGWRAEVARALAASVDSKPNASTARELRLLMQEAEEGVVSDEPSKADELKARRAARLAEAANQ